MVRVLYPQERKESMEEAWVHELMLERMQRCEEAIARAKAGVATEEDWEVIRYECGLGKEQKNAVNR